MTSIGTDISTWRTFAATNYVRADTAPAAQKLEGAPPFSPAPRTPPSPEDIIRQQQNNGIWINPQSMQALITGQELTSLTQGEARELVAARRAGTRAYAKIELSEEGKRFTAAAIDVQDKIREILSAQGKAPGDKFTFGMFDGKPRLQMDKGDGTGLQWADAPTKEIGDLVKTLWATRTVDTTTRRA